MDKIRVLFLTQSSGEDTFTQDIESISSNLKSLDALTLSETVSIKEAKEKLVDNDVLIMLLDRDHSDAWQQLDDFMEESEKLYYLGFIVIFGFQGKNLLENATEAMLRTIYPFVCPIDFDVLHASIKAIDSKMKYKKSLVNFKKDLLEADNLNSIVSKALEQLKHHPLVGYQEASISLVDRKNKPNKRYLLKIDPSNLHGDRSLQKNIQDDKLITKVDQDTVVILESIYAEESTEQFIDWGWEYDKVSTQHIKSWIGLAAKYQGQTVAIITLHHQRAGQYKKSNQKLVNFLRDFGEIFANAVEDLFIKRNQSVVKEIINQIADDLNSKELVKNILLKLQDTLKCNTCNYFSIGYHSNSKERYLSELTSTKDDSEKSNHTFKKGVGIVGAVLKDGKSRIVPHASEDGEFVSTINYPGYNLSMLAVPVIQVFYEDSNNLNRIIGIICCHRKEPDYFTVYDRYLVEEIAISIATVIQRTMTLELSNEISSEMAKLVVDEKKIGELLNNICNHVLKITSAGSASIHLLTYLEDQKKYSFLETRDDVKHDEASPRLNGNGTTDLVIEKGETVEFSEKLGNFNRIAPEQRQKGVKYKIVVPLIIVKDEDKLIIGALYLTKCDSGEPLSKVEKFALELFASQAASIINDSNILKENKFRADAHDRFVDASTSIAGKDDIDLLLKDIAEYSCSLVAADLSYLVTCDATNKLEAKTASPEDILNDLKDKLKSNSSQENKIGIIGLAVQKKESIIINDINEEKENNSEYWQSYIKFKKETCSQLSVPILRQDNTVIGVINLEDEKPYFFTKLHQKIIEHFARQVAIAFHKREYIDRITNNNHLLSGLHQSLSNIMSESSESILYQVASMTREALGAKEVFVIICKNGKYDNKNNQFIPDRCGTGKEYLEKISLDVYNEVVQRMFYSDRDRNLDQDKNDSNQKEFEKLGLDGLCLPLSSGLDNQIGVMWIFFSKPIDKKQLEEDKDVYKLYLNQIALAYNNCNQFEELKKKASEDLSKKIDVDIIEARKEANYFSYLTLGSSAVGLVLIFGGLIWSLTNNGTNPKNSIDTGKLTAISGVLVQAVTVLAFNRGKEANDRVDKYHKEVYTVGQLNILLSATEQLDPRIIQEEKQKIIQTTTTHWLESINEIKNTDKTNEVKKPDQ
jgi:transcriptional regulator with GAF, ATPase, and Fis domain